MVSFALTVHICYRKQVRVDEIFVHENYTNTGSKENDIALLRLGNVSLKQSKDDMEFPHEGIFFERYLCSQKKGLTFQLFLPSAYPRRTTI